MIEDMHGLILTISWGGEGGQPAGGQGHIYMGYIDMYIRYLIEYL